MTSAIHTSDIPLTIVDDSSNGDLLGLYVQDEWRIESAIHSEL